MTIIEHLSTFRRADGQGYGYLYLVRCECGREEKKTRQQLYTAKNCSQCARKRRLKGLYSHLTQAKK